METIMVIAFQLKLTIWKNYDKKELGNIIPLIKLKVYSIN